MNVKENTKRFSATQETRPMEATRRCYTAGLTVAMGCLQEPLTQGRKGPLGSIHWATTCPSGTKPSRVFFQPIFKRLLVMEFPRPPQAIYPGA